MLAIASLSIRLFEGKVGRVGRKKERNTEKKAKFSFFSSPLPSGRPDAYVSLCPVVTGPSP